MTEIQQWLATVDRSLCTGKVYDVSSYEGQDLWPEYVSWPENLKSLSTHYVNLSLDDDNHLKIRLTWGGAFAHWGFVIGSPEMVIPKTRQMTEEIVENKGISQSLWTPGEYRLPMAPGAYVFHELQ